MLGMFDGRKSRTQRMYIAPVIRHPGMGLSLTNIVYGYSIFIMDELYTTAMQFTNIVINIIIMVDTIIPVEQSSFISWSTHFVDN